MTKTEHDDEPLILFLHPIGLDRYVWSDVMVSGSAALDFPGHSMTQSADPVSMAGLADWVLGHISRPATLVGLSLGGIAGHRVLECRLRPADDARACHHDPRER